MLPTGINIHIKPGRTDMRKQINGLAAIVHEFMGLQPMSGDLFLFCGSGFKILRALYWDRNGFCLWTKRLERGSFPWPNGIEARRKLTDDELRMILDGIDFRKRFQNYDFSHVS
jgi:transposase